MPVVPLSPLFKTNTALFALSLAPVFILRPLHALCEQIGFKPMKSLLSPMKVEMTKLKWQLRKAQHLALKHSKSARFNGALQAQYRQVSGGMQEYYAARKRLVEMKSDTLIQRFESKVFKLQLEQLQIALGEKQLQWHRLLGQIKR